MINSVMIPTGALPLNRTGDSLILPPSPGKIIHATTLVPGRMEHSAAIDRHVDDVNDRFWIQPMTHLFSDWSLIHNTRCSVRTVISQFGNNTVNLLLLAKLLTMTLSPAEFHRLPTNPYWRTHTHTHTRTPRLFSLYFGVSVCLFLASQ